MNKKINLILKDLYQIDPNLKKYQKKIVPIIKQLLKSKPEAKLNQKFRQELKTELLNKIKEIKLKSKKRKNNRNWKVFFVNLIPFLKPTAWAFAGAIIAIIIVVPLLQSSIKKTGEQTVNLFNTNINQVAEKGFGKLAWQANQPSAGNTESQKIAGLGGGTGLKAPIQAPNIISPLQTAYNFKYQGLDFNLTQQEMPVFKKQNLKNKVGINKLLKNTSFKIVNLNQFKNLQVQTIQLVEDRKNGYVVFLNIAENHLSINLNWEEQVKIQQDKNQLTIDDIPNDQTIINTALAFLKQYNINLKNYGSPQVQKPTMLLRQENYVPETLTVVFPQIINGQKVYNQAGEPCGVYISVNIKNLKVLSLHGLKTESFESSNYPIETNPAEILAWAEKGGLHYQNPQNPKETITLQLDTPEKIYARIWQFDQNKKTSKELLIPALKFKILNKSQGKAYYLNNHIIVPLVKEILQQ